MACRLDGKVCENYYGQVGIVTDNKVDTYFGMSLDGRLTWQGINPKVISDSLYEYLTKDLENALEGSKVELKDAVSTYLAKLDKGMKKAKKRVLHVE